MAGPAVSRYVLSAGQSTYWSPSLRDKMITDEISRQTEAERADRARNGHETMRSPRDHHCAVLKKYRASCAFSLRAGDGNRTPHYQLGKLRRSGFHAA